MTKQVLPDKFVQVTCPKCGEPMRKRNGRYGNFWGCSTYPKCKGTRSVKEVKALVTKLKGYNKPGRKFKPSPFQQTIFDFISNGDGNAVVEAVAGSGKTTTIVKALALTSKADKVLFCAFNKHIADELSSRSPKHVKVGTLHSLGFAALRQALPTRPEVDNFKVWNIIKEELPLPKDYPLRAPLKKLVSLAKATLVDVTNPIAVEAMATYYSVAMNSEGERLIKLLPRVMAKCLDRTYIIDFDDMIWMPIVMGLPVTKYDWVFVDEAQDVSTVQIKLILKMCAGRVVAVGDRKQGIYGFRGADNLAIPRLIEALNAQVLPLSISYRCPKSHVELAKKLVPQIEAAEWAKDGVVRHIPYYKFMEEVGEGDLVLCRVNAPLVKACYSLIRRGQKAVIRGRDIGKQMGDLIDRMKTSDIHDLLTKLQEYKWQQSRRLKAAGKEGQIESLHDRCDTLEALCDGIRDLSELRHRITTIFDDITKNGVILSSVHRAKGDEADRVFIVKPELMPHPLATQPWQLEQEMNIKYVALTRSKLELVFVDG